MNSSRKKIKRWIIAAHVLVAGMVVMPISFRQREQPVYDAMPVRVVQASAYMPMPTAAAETMAPEPSTPAPPPRPAPPEPAPPKPAPKPPVETTRQPEPRQEKPRKPEWQPRTADEIRQSAQLDPVTEPQPQPQRQVDTDRIERQLQDRLGRISSTSNAATASSTNRSASIQAADNYNSIVTNVLVRRWSQPSRLEVGGASPVTRVQLTINADGSIDSARIVRPSGNQAMDRSVQQLLNGLNRLPPPRNNGIRENRVTININFEIE